MLGLGKQPPLLSAMLTDAGTREILLLKSKKEPHSTQTPPKQIHGIISQASGNS